MYSNVQEKTTVSNELCVFVSVFAFIIIISYARALEEAIVMFESLVEIVFLAYKVKIQNNSKIIFYRISIAYTRVVRSSVRRPKQRHFFAKLIARNYVF